MKIIIDNKIPYIRETIERIADEVIYIPGKEFTPEVVRDADALIIRTRTHCNRELLEGSRVKFIATATIGFDHIDTEYCRAAGITWTNAPGCNSASVAQYIESVLALLKLTKGKELNKMCMGIVGVGNVGSKIIKVAESQGMRVLLNDLPREENEGGTQFSSLKEIAQECDVITFHVPLYKEGKYKTYHLADEQFFHSLKRKPILINTSRGEVIETEALLKALETETISEAIIDVWENEPNINAKLLDKVIIGTPHIAGYSADGKANATRMSLDALCLHFGIKTAYTIIPMQPENTIIQAPTREEALLKIYDPRQDSNRLKSHPEQFEQLRGDYPLRREKEAYTIEEGRGENGEGKSTM
ncbi:4-phosphoerythronate dehydrogenase PdxB [Bacteroides sp.]